MFNNTEDVRQLRAAETGWLSSVLKVVGPGGDGMNESIIMFMFIHHVHYGSAVIPLLLFSL